MLKFGIYWSDAKLLVIVTCANIEQPLNDPFHPQQDKTRPQTALPLRGKTDRADTLSIAADKRVPLYVLDTARAESFRQIIGTRHFFGYGG
jgi:hypothetical protein